ncbi:phytoene dehydrogenase-like oxidoreductase [Burkholderiales bacterium JOSHI_001]|nr:phytoene dehydrogenase-like oxidoreductase [Burkholderiales bacterium JOSHI_001]
MSKRTAALIGGGHNGLVCAFYLARAGFDVTVFERRGVVGGAAVTESFHPGFRNSVASYTVSLLAPHIIADMRLHERGLRILERPLSNFLPLSDTQFLKLGGGLARTQAEVAKYSAKDAAALPAYYARLDAMGDLLRELSRRTPPDLLSPSRSLPRAWAQARLLNGLNAVQKRDLLALFTQSAAEFLDAWFESDPVKTAFGFDAVVGHFDSPYSPGSAYVLLHHTFGGVNGKKGIWGHAVGGMGAITQAMARACEAHGVVLRTDSPVARVQVNQGRATGVQLEDGSRFSADLVAANVNPHLLFTRMVDAADLPADFAQRMAHYKSHSGTLRMNVALSELPSFTCLPNTGPALAEHHASGIIMAPSLAYMDRAHQDARAFGWSRQPIVEMLIPSSVDDSLAPPGQHVASLFCQHFAYTLPDGQTWDDCREQAADLVTDTVTRWAPNFKRSVLGRMVLTPLDLERTFGLVGGDIFHGVMSLNQMWAARPVLGHGDHRAPIAGLYLCGSGTHPGGGVSGLPGYNAAREIRRDHSAWAALKFALAGE